MKRYMTMRYPAAWHGEMWREGAPCGNGTVGALVYGSVAREIVMLNHAQLWRNGKIQEIPDISYTLPQIRGFIENHKPELANNLLSDALHEKGYNACTSELFPLGDIIIDRVSTSVQKHYRRTVDMENAEVTVEWQERETRYKRRLFVSRYDGFVYMQISADKPGTVDIDVTLDVHDRETAGNTPEIINTETKTSDGYIYYAGQNTFTSFFLTLLSFISSVFGFTSRQIFADFSEGIYNYCPYRFRGTSVSDRFARFYFELCQTDLD